MWLRWFFTDRTTGRWVVAQWPNLPLWAWIVATLLGVHWLALAALVVWALLELARGASPFRRVLGAAALLSQVV
jgi:hypothetical protein